MRSRPPRAGFSSVASAFRVPEHTRNTDSLPMCGSLSVLKTSAVTGALASGRAHAGLLGLEVGAAHVAAVDRRRELVHDQVEQRVTADALGGRRAQDGNDLALGDAGPQRLEHLGLGQRALLEILGQEIVVGLGGGFHQLLAPLLHRVGELGRDGGLAGLAIGEDGRLLGDQIDVAAEAALLADRHVHRHDAPLEAAAQRLQRAEEVGALAVEAIDDDGAGQIELAGELPDLLGLHLHAGHRVDHHHRRLHHPQAGARVGDQIPVARRVDQIDPVALVVAVGDRGVDRDLPLDLVGIEVGGGAAVVHLAQPVDRTGGEQHRLHQRGLAHTPVPDDPDVADLPDVDRH